MKRLGDSALFRECCRRWLGAASAAFVCLAFVAVVQAQEGEKSAVTEIAVKKSAASLEVRIKGSESLTYQTYELPKPARVVIDVANATLTSGITADIPKDTPIQLQTKEIADASPQILRFEFILKKSLPYTTKQDGKDILVNFELQKPAVAGKSKTNAASGKALAKQLPDTSKAAGPARSSQGNETFGFSGYERERISVDFYKMDLHNVFRFLREVSGTNIIVDESVQGTLTLTLDDVPWDFALDAILNLKDLKKEERYNTIVIYPKSKDFIWPNKTVSKLSFQADEDIAQQDALVITQMEQQPVGLVEASQLIARGREFEKAHNPTMAVQAYEQAFEKWSSNAKLANRISAIYLVELRQNAKALQYAKSALAINKKDRVAALNAAIASANMRSMQAAASYFDMCVQGDSPSQEALLSYALFREEARQYDLALQILAKHDSLYGRTLEATVAKARILDKKGASSQAVQAYREILSSGFALPSDLSRFVRARVGMAN